MILLQDHSKGTEDSKQDSSSQEEADAPDDGSDEPSKGTTAREIIDIWIENGKKEKATVKALFKRLGGNKLSPEKKDKVQDKLRYQVKKAHRSFMKKASSSSIGKALEDDNLNKVAFSFHHLVKDERSNGVEFQNPGTINGLHQEGKVGSTQVGRSEADVSAAMPDFHV